MFIILVTDKRIILSILDIRLNKVKLTDLSEKAENTIIKPIRQQQQQQQKQ